MSKMDPQCFFVSTTCRVKGYGV